MSTAEEAASTHHDRLSVVRPGGSPTWPDIWVPRLERCVRAGDADGALRILRTVVPDYEPSTDVLAEARPALPAPQDVVALPA
jgi:hypothetical protein